MPEIRFGAFAPQGWKTELIGIPDPVDKWAACLGTTVLAEELGYDSIWVYDHFHNVPQPTHEAVFECWTTMAALATATSTIRLGQMVSCTSYRPPALTAKITSTLDVISGGRLDWGVGAGWYANEYAAYDYEFPEPKVRIGMLREAVELVKMMWTEPDATYDGKYYQIAGAQCDPKPLQKPHPPIWIGGGGEQLTLRVVARLGDKSNFGGKPDEFAHKRDVLHGHCQDVGRDADEIELTWSPEVFVRETDAEIRELVAAGEAGSRWGEPYESWKAGNLVGTPDEVAEKVRTYVDLGCTYFLPWCADYPSDQTLRLFATKVMPEFPVMSTRRLSVIVGVTLTIGAACSGSSSESSRTTSTTAAPDQSTLTFYVPPTVLAAGEPGDVLNTAPLALGSDMPGVGQKITFVSTTPAGDKVPVTGVLIQPLTPPPPAGYPVVVWAHGTTGIGDQCAPSLSNPFEIPGSGPLLQAGYAIAAPDYEGLGTPDEIHPYLVGTAEGHNVLDAARAAKTIGGGSTVVAWGWSQGGQAALFSAELAHSYAPELDYRGVAANAPVTDLRTFLLPGVTDVAIFPFTAEAILSWSEVYDEAELTDLVAVQDAEKARLAQQACTGDIADNTTRPLDQIFRSDPQNTATWSDAAATNSVSASRITSPALLTHGDADPTVPVAGTEELFEELCSKGRDVEFLRNAAWTHYSAYLDPMAQVTAWIMDRINGVSAPSTC